MALFTYKAIDASGKAVIGQLEAVNPVDLELRLKRMGLDLVVGGQARREGRPKHTDRHPDSNCCLRFTRSPFGA